MNTLEADRLGDHTQAHHDTARNQKLKGIYDEK